MSRRNKGRPAGAAAGAGNKPAGSAVNNSQALTMDAFSNPLFRLGLGSQAPIEGTSYPLTRTTDNYALLNSLYRDNWVVQNVVEIIPGDMLREWFTLTGDVTPERVAEFERITRATQLRDRLNAGLCWGRLYGGAAGLIMIKGQEDLSQPLDIDSIMPGAYQGIYILDRWSGIMPDVELVDDPSDADFNLPRYYSITNAIGETIARVHHSRILRFTGRELPFLEKVAEMYWGESEIEALYSDLVKHDNVSHNMANLTFRANLDVYTVQNLDQLLSTSSRDQQRRFWDVVQAQSVIKSNFGMQLVNRGDEIRNYQYTFTGLKDIYDSMCLDLSGAAHIPVTKLFGRSPAGMNATGESDLKNYYDYVDGLRESKLRPVLDRLLPVLLMSAWGEVPADVDIQFPPLWTPTAREVADIANAKTETVINAFQAGLMDRSEAMQELKKLSDETGLFESIAEESIAAAAGQTYQDVTALKDPLAGIKETSAFDALPPVMSLDGGKGSGNFGHAGRPGKVGGSAQGGSSSGAPEKAFTSKSKEGRIKADAKTQKQHADAISKLSGTGYEDGTYNLDTLEPVNYSSGYQVTFSQIGDNYSASQYADKVNEFLDASSDGITSAGKFGGTPEVSFHVSSKAAAAALAKKYNQQSIWDWSAGHDISTGGTGRVK